MINFVISPSQQKTNRCIMGDIEQEHMHLIARDLYIILSQDQRLNVYLVPKQDLGNDKDNLKAAVRLSNDFINRNGGKGYHLALHSDAGAYAQGASALYYSQGGLKFLTPIATALTDLTPWPDVGIRQRTDLYELKRTMAIAGLLEVSFHDIKQEGFWIHENHNKIAVRIADGIYSSLMPN